MDNTGGVDDQGSGWSEVKKKHRSSSKFPLKSWVGGSSGKSSSNFPCSQQSLNKSNGNGKQKSDPPPAGGKSDIHIQSSSGNSLSLLDGEKKDTRLDKCVVIQDHGGPKLPPLSALNGGSDCQKKSQNDRRDLVTKIKWGDLEDDSFVLGENSVGAGIKFGDLEDVNLVASRKHAANQDLVPNASSRSELQGKKLVEMSDGSKVSAQPLLSTQRDGLFEDKCQDGNEIPSEDTKAFFEKEIVVDTGNNVSLCEDIHADHNKASNNDSMSITKCASGEEAGIVVNPCEPDVLLMLGDSESEAQGSNLLSVMENKSHDSELVSTERSGPANLEGFAFTDSVEEGQISHDGGIHDDMPNTQIASSFEEGETGESRERFRERLWCFLFENLNRAVDELYLLCELECDSEQMKEALLVLEEAASDFRELFSRVEDFEKVKRSSSHLIDGIPITLKNDPRRPHALSWEVRRMTTSPHRAEILSSSLEAFKKIQQERASMHASRMKKASETVSISPPVTTKPRMQREVLDLSHGEKQNVRSSRSNRVNIVQNGRFPAQHTSSNDGSSSKQPVSAKLKREQLESEVEKILPKKDKMITEGNGEKNQKSTDHFKRPTLLSEKDKEKEKRNSAPWKSMDAWKEKRNWEDILSSSLRGTSRVSHSPGMSRRSVERVRVLHDKLMTPEKKKKKTALDLKKEAEEKHARAMKIRSELENERVQKLQRTSEKLNRVNEWQAVRTMKLREGMYARHQRSESRHEAFLAQVVKRAGDESSKVNEVRFITSLNEENKKLILRQKLHGSELRRAEKLQVMKTKQKEDLAREEAVLERRKLLEAEKLQRLAEIRRKKEEAKVRREEERKASSAAREARAVEQLRRKEERAKAQQEEAELLAQKLAERLSESEQRRKFYLEQIRERASMDFRDQSSPLLRRSVNKDGVGRSTSTNNGEDLQTGSLGLGGSSLVIGNSSLQHSTKRRIKKIRQRLMALKYDFPDPAAAENVGIGFRKAIGIARVKIGRWLQELQRLSQARKEGATSIGLIIAEMIKYLDGKDPELQASRQAGLIDFIASALPASHTSKPEACQVMIHFLKLLRVVLSVPANRSYFLAQNLLPPIIPMLSTALENYIKIAASINSPSNPNASSSKTLVENFEPISEVLDGFLWTVTTIIGHGSAEEPELQMWDGLLELLIAYQVIHRLRDLFALHDRPQVEGSSFPSSILSSIHLLVVLTSRPGTTSSIVWESLPLETMKGNESLQSKFADSGNSRVTDTNEAILNGGVVEQILSKTEDRLKEESCELDKSGEKEQTGCLVEENGASNVKFVSSDEHQNVEEISNSLVPKNTNTLISEQPSAFLLSSISDTGLVSLPSLLTAVLLQANNKLSSEQVSYILPSNFEEVATGVLKVLNNLALLDLKFMQGMLARPDLKMEFFHLMSFLLSHCTSKWKAPSHQIGMLLLESMLLLGHFALFHPGNQAVLRWGKSPTILHKVCDLPFVFFSDPDLMPILAGTLVSACYGCEQNKCVVEQEISTEMLLSLLSSCRNASNSLRPSPTLENPVPEDSNDSNQRGSELRKSQLSRNNCRTGKLSLGKPGAWVINGMRTGKTRNQKDSSRTKASEETGFKYLNNQSALEFASVMLHSRFPSGFIDRAEQFFSSRE